MMFFGLSSVPRATPSAAARLAGLAAAVSLSLAGFSLAHSAAAAETGPDASPVAAAGQGWVALFNGQNLDGWAEHSGTAKYYVQDGLLVGETVPGSGNSFLCTKQEFGDFELDLEYKCDALLNSGVQIRSECFPDARTIEFKGKKIKFAPDRVHGYQCEIDMDVARGRMWTGGIYDEARRGWLFPADGEQGKQGLAFSKQGRQVSQPDEWNKLHIEAIGPSIKTWLNGEPRADLRDTLTPRGLIGLQVHSVGGDASRVGLKICFRNIRLRPIASPVPPEPPPNVLTEQEKSEGWRLLWNGQTPEGWRSAGAETFPARGWTIHDGVLTVHLNGTHESPGGGDIVTREVFTNFELKVDFKITPRANSGIKYFVHPIFDPAAGPDAKKPSGGAIGYEYQILDDLLHPDAKLGRNGNRTLGSLYDLLPAAADKQPAPIGEWNSARIVLRDNSAQHWLNGRMILAYDRASAEFQDAFAHSKFKKDKPFPTWTRGHILLQDHGDEVSFRNLKIRLFPASAPSRE